MREKHYYMSDIEDDNEDDDELIPNHSWPSPLWIGFLVFSLLSLIFPPIGILGVICLCLWVFLGVIRIISAFLP